MLILASTFAMLFYIRSNIQYERKYNLLYRNKILEPLLKLVCPELKYKTISDDDISEIEKDYNGAKFNKPYLIFSITDCIEGFISDKIYIKLVYIFAKKRVKNINPQDVFAGVFASTKCDKDIKTYVKISKNRQKIIEKENKVEMNSQEFKKYFYVYSENDVITKQVLTNEMMESLLYFYKKYKLKFEVVFVNNTIYLRFFSGDIFAAPLIGSSINEDLFRTYSVLKFVVEVTKKLNEIMGKIEVEK